MRLGAHVLPRTQRPTAPSILVRAMMTCAGRAALSAMLARVAPVGKASLGSRVGLQVLPAEAWIGVRARSEDDRVVVEVEDTGSGIPAEVSERIFDPYRRFVEDSQ